MASHAANGFPAGDESDGSNDEWDIGYSSTKRTSENKASEAEDEVVEDDVFRFKQAISRADIQAVEQLLDKGVDVETKLGFEWTPLMCAVNLANHDMAELLLARGASANFSKACFTTLMAACTASASEDAIVRCVDLLLSRHADPNVGDSFGMTCLMQAARDGYSKVLNLLVSHGAEVDSQDSKGYTALAFAVQYGRVEATLKMLQLGADKTIMTNNGESPVELALTYKHAMVTRILTSSDQHYRQYLTSEEAPMDKSGTLTSKESLTKLGDLEVFLHGLNLSHLSDIMRENDITWSCLLTMEKEDLEKIGITDTEEQQKVLKAVQQMHLDTVNMDTLSQLDGIDSSCEDLHSFLIGLQQQCCYLTEVVQDVVRRFPQRSSELVFSLDPKKEAQAACNQLLVQTGDLQREVSCLRDLLSNIDQAGGSCRLPLPRSHSNRRGWLLTIVTLSTFGALLFFSRMANGKVHLLMGRGIQ